MNLPSRPTSILLDAQLLVLRVVGGASRAYIAKHKRLRDYDLRDFDLLVGLLAPPCRLIVTPNVLTEASNLIAHIADPARTEARLALRRLIGIAEETFVPSDTAAANPAFLRLGLADAACLATDTVGATLLTADLALYLAAENAGRKVINFRHLREASG